MSLKGTVSTTLLLLSRAGLTLAGKSEAGQPERRPPSRRDVIAFPVGHADRLSIQEGYQGRAYQIRDGVARLVWCGTPPQAGEQVSRLRGNAGRALGLRFRTMSGVLPVERGGMDVFTGFAGAVTTSRMNAAGKIVCSKRRFDEREFRSAFQFGARDTCP